MDELIQSLEKTASELEDLAEGVKLASAPEGDVGAQYIAGMAMALGVNVGVE